MKRNRMYQDRDELASHMVNIWRDAIAWKYDHPTLMNCFQRVYDDKRWKRLPQYQREYVRGFARSFEVNVVDRMHLEHGNWVVMPDGSEKWFGVRERLNNGYREPITARYIHENQIAGRSGIYWVADAEQGSRKGCAPGERPFFVPAIHSSQA